MSMSCEAWIALSRDVDQFIGPESLAEPDLPPVKIRRAET